MTVPRHRCHVLRSMAMWAALVICVAGRVAALPEDSACLGGWLRLHGTSVVERVEVLTVLPGAPLARVGIEPNDTLSALYDTPLTGLPPRVVHDILAQAAVSTSPLPAIVRRGTDAPRHVMISNTPRTAALATLVPAPDAASALAAALLRDTPTMPPCWDVVTNRLAVAAAWRADPWHHWLSTAALHQPHHAAACAEQACRAALQAARAGAWHDVITGEAHDTAPAPSFLAALTRADHYARRAFAAFSAEEISFIRTHVPVMVYQLDRYFYLHDDPDRARYQASWRVINAAQRLSMPDVHAACASLCAAAHLALSNDWRALPVNPSLSVPGCSGALRAVLTTEVGLVVIGGDGNNTYDPGPPFIIDTGGNDIYRNRCAAQPERPVSLVLDFDGDDEHSSTGAMAVAAGITGIDIIIDCRGNDYYSCPVLGVGAGVFGIGALIDLAGHDRYLGERCVQGIGLFGAGAIIDAGGHDSYLALRFAQAVGLPGGEGRICDLRGDDIYVALLGTPSVYGMPGVYNGLSQGAGIGFRLLAAGGAGLLIDGAGNDRYECGEFAQGAGYYLGCGVLFDAAGNDHYRATRYCQAAAAHTAAGVLLDLAGNDCYNGRVTAVLGAAWDTSVAVFRDCAGHDSYHSSGLALGTACIGSYAECIDLEGNDRYHFQPPEAPGVSWLRAGETNCALFIDAHGNDIYAPAAAHSDNMQTIRGDCGVFFDGEASRQD